MGNQLKITRKQIPHLPGIYIYKNKKSEIVYIGKAKNLYYRVNSYFTGAKDLKTTALVKQIAHIEYTVTSNETEALLLENNLIKNHNPKYNIDLKDAKSFPYIVVTKGNLPRLFKTRDAHLKKVHYFGPFVKVHAADALINTLQDFLKLRRCKKKFSPPYNYPLCLNYHLELCSGPCASKISENDYLNSVNLAIHYLQGNTQALIKKLTQQMLEFSQEMNYEKALKNRNTINMLTNLLEEQNIETDKKTNADYIGFFIKDSIAAVSLFIVRNGKVIDRFNYFFATIIHHEDFISDFISHYYLNAQLLPDSIYLNSILKDKSLIEDSLHTQHKKSIKLLAPWLQKDKKLIKIAEANAAILYEEKKLQIDKIHHLRELKEILNLSRLPRHIECVDIATLQGKFNTAAVSVFIDGKPDPTSYRQYNIKGEGKPDDYAMMKEVIIRRYQKAMINKKKLPDLVVLDGGKGQLSAVSEVIDILQIPITIISIAEKNEYLYVRNRKKPIILPERSNALKIIQAVRDEAHRFSNTRMKRSYQKSSLQSELLSIKGIGRKRAELLHSKGLTASKLATMNLETLTNTLNAEGIGQSLAKKIYEYFHSQNLK